MRRLDEMIMELQEAGVKMSELINYCQNLNDKKTTIYEAVNDCYEDYFAEEIEAQKRADRDYWDKVDELYERKRDEGLL